MDRQLGTLEIVKSQRDGLAVAYHDLQVEHTLLKESLVLTNKLLEIANAKIAELDWSVNNVVDIADHAAIDAAA